MKKIRIGKEFSVRWGLILNGLPAELDKMDVKVILVNPFGKRSSLSYTVDRNVLVIPVGRNVQHMTGAYTLSLWINKDKDGQTVVDCSPAFCLVPSTDEESCAQVQAIKEVLDLGTSEIQIGVQGKSAYQTWLDEGNEGTEQDFLNWLRQPSTDAGTDATAAAAKATEAASKADKAAEAATAAATEAQRIATESAAQSEQRVTTAIEGLNQSVSQAEHKVTEAVSKAAEATNAAQSAAESATASSAKAEASSSKADASKAEADKAAEAATAAATEAQRIATESAAQSEQRVTTAIEGLNQSVSQAEHKVTEAVSKAAEATNAAQSAAESATASSAKAEASSSKADASKAEADKAAEAARTATQEAHAAKQGADSAAQTATEAAGRADAAAGSVNTAISNATAAADKANASSAKADSSAAKADAATTRATTAAQKAEEMTAAGNKVLPTLEGYKEHLDKITTEYNVSVFHPASGTGNSNKYTLATAIVQVPEGLRVAGLVVSFLNESNKVEKWEFQGGSWAVASFKKPSGGGGNMILPYKTDVATTRKQVQESERVPGMQISYKGASGWVNEQFIGSAVTDAEWAKDANWEQVANAKMVNQINDKIQSMETNGNALAGDVGVGKQQIADAITKKGVPTKSTDSFAKMSENIGKIYKGAYDDSFAIFIDFTNPSPEVQRIGSAAFPNWLEESVQNIMVKDGEVNYNLNRKNSMQKDTGLPAVIDGTDGDIMNDWPRFWYSPVLTDNGLRITFSNVPQYSEGWIESRRKWAGATEMVIRNHGGKQTAHSCFNMDPEYRGGNGTNWDSLPKSLLGMPKTQISHDGMRTACVNKGTFKTGDYHNWDYELFVKANLMFMAIFGTRNWQAEFAGYDPETGNPKRNSDGFRYGGLGRGIVDKGSWWSGFNGNNPFIRTNVGLELGCGSGVVDYNLNIGSEDSTNAIYLHVPVFCGVVNPFGHIWKAMDGITKSIELADGGKQEVWGIFTNPKRYASAGIDGAAKVVRKTAVLNNGFLSKIDENLLPTETKGNESSHFCDYYYLNANPGRYSVWLGGNASHGGGAGGWSVASSDGVGAAFAYYGGRLCFTPS